MAKAALPKDIEMPKFADKTKAEPKSNETPKEEPKMKKVEETKVTKAPETKEALEKKDAPKIEEVKVEEKPAKVEETKEEKPVKAEQTTKSEPTNLPEDIEDYEYLLKPKQPMLKGWRIFLPYLFAFLYNLLLVVALVALFTLPIVKLADASALDTFYAQDANALPFNLVNVRTQILTSLGMADKFAGLYSIGEIAFQIIMSNMAAGPSGILVAVSNMFGFITMAILLVIMVIWFTIKLIHSLLGLISLIFPRKRHKVIDNFFFKNTHQYYKLGILDRDYTFVVFLIYTIFLVGFMNMKAIIGMFNLTGQAADIVGGIVIFKAFENTDLMNFGNIALAVVLGALLVFRIIYKIIVHGLSRKVKKSYVLKKKKRKNK